MKYFVISDIHSCYTPVIKELTAQGYDKNNPDHILICCGDIFDRGDETLQVYEFLRSIPRERRVLIRGNHEYLLQELYNKPMPDYYDRSNGTVKTVQAFTGESEATIMYMGARYGDTKKLREVIDWIYSDEWVNYFELNNYIFVHSFIPLDTANHMKYDPNWRNITDDSAWQAASWGCPYTLYEEYFNEEIKKGKILVYGHWHTWRIRKYYEGEAEQLDFSIFRKDNQIGLDSCINYSNIANVLVLEF